MKRFIPAQIKHKKEQVIFSFGKKKRILMKRIQQKIANFCK
jgi:hypothetical protein